MLTLLDLSPDSSSCPGQLLRTYFRSKRVIQEVYELEPPPFRTSAENPGTLDLIRSLTLNVNKCHCCERREKKADVDESQGEQEPQRVEAVARDVGGPM